MKKTLKFIKNFFIIYFSLIFYKSARMEAKKRNIFKKNMKIGKNSEKCGKNK